MSNSLIQNSRGLHVINHYDVSSSQSDITLNIGDGQGCANFYLMWDNVSLSIASAYLKIRVTKSGVAESSGNYDYVKSVKHNALPTTSSGQAEFAFEGIASGEVSTGYGYLFNVTTATNDFMIFDETITGANIEGNIMAGTVTLATASDGINISTSSGTIDNGMFRLYGFGLDQ